MKCDILYICGQLDYGNSVSGNYIFYKLLKQLHNVNLKVLPLFSKTEQDIDYNDFLNYIPPTQENIPHLLASIPEHKILVISGNDFPLSLIDYICKTYKSKLVIITMTHWLYGNNSEYPELNDMFLGDVVNNRLRIFENYETYIINGSSYSAQIHSYSKFCNIKNVILPFPFEEIEIDDNFQKSNDTNKKVILWGTTQPETPRKGKDYFEKILNSLYEMCDNPDDIMIKTIGPKSEINTKFSVEYLGSIPNRKELSKVYKNVHVFALTTLADAGPMMATECIRNNTPLVSFSTNIATDLVSDGKNGYIVNSIEEYAFKLYEILYNEKFHMDLDYVKKFNSQETVATKYNEFFNKLLK